MPIAIPSGFKLQYASLEHLQLSKAHHRINKLLPRLIPISKYNKIWERRV